MKRTLYQGEYQAELYVDPKLHPAIYHYVITRQSENEIVMCGQERSHTDAEQSALHWMTELSTESMAQGD